MTAVAQPTARDYRGVFEVHLTATTLGQIPSFSSQRVSNCAAAAMSGASTWLSSFSLRARFTVIVEPDAFYENFFETLLSQGTGKGTAQLRDALEDTRRSPFTIFDQTFALVPRPR